MRIAVLGLGRMGQAIASRLLEKGYEVTVWNRTPGKEGGLVAGGARAASSPQEAVSAANVVMTLLTADTAVKAVHGGEVGILKSAGAETICVDMSTVSPATSRELAEAVPGRFIDAPILGGPEVTAKGQAKLLLGGDEATVKRLDGLWGDISSGYVYCGPNGSATTMKLLSNLNLMGGTILMAEAVVTARANGIDEEVVRKVIGDSPAVAPGVRVRFEDVLGGDHEGWWSVQLAEKDIDLALELARDKDITLTMAGAVEEVLRRTEAAGYGEKDLGAVVEAVRGREEAMA